MKTCPVPWSGLCRSPHCHVTSETRPWSCLPLVNILYLMYFYFSCFLELQTTGLFQPKLFHFKIKLSTHWQNIPCVILKTSGPKRWRKQKLECDSTSTQAVWLTCWGGFSAVLSLAFLKRSRARGRGGTKPPSNSFDPWPARGRAGWLRASEQPERCWKQRGFNKAGVANPGCCPGLAAVVFWALLSSAPQQSFWPYRLSPGILTASL